MPRAEARPPSSQASTRARASRAPARAAEPRSRRKHQAPGRPRNEAHRAAHAQACSMIESERLPAARSSSSFLL
jgi:hypothetical protein